MLVRRRSADSAPATSADTLLTHRLPVSCIICNPCCRYTRCAGMACRTALALTPTLGTGAALRLGCRWKAMAVAALATPPTAALPHHLADLRRHLRPLNTISARLGLCLGAVWCQQGLKGALPFRVLVAGRRSLQPAAALLLS